MNSDLDEEAAAAAAAVSQQWAAIDRLPTLERLRSSLFVENIEESGDSKAENVVINVSKLGPLERRGLVEKLIRHIEHDNLRLLQKIRKRMDKAGVAFPTVEVRYRNLKVKAECEVVYGKPLPTLSNSLKSIIMDGARLLGLPSREAQINIINDVSGIIKPGRMTLLLGPPGCGKTTFLKALSGNLNKSLKVEGEISYNGYKLEEFVAQKTSAYISQYDQHIPEMTVREALDFSSRCQGIGSRAEILMELIRREKEAKIVPNPDIDAYMKAIALEGQETTLQTDYILKILGLDICADTLVGDVMRRGISGGQKKRLTTGEMLVGPARALFMDEISNGLDSSTTYQIVSCLQQLAHFTDATILVSLLQPAPETFSLFDDVILMAEGKIVYQGPRTDVLEFFDSCGFKCPSRKGVADFLQEASAVDCVAFFDFSSLQVSVIFTFVIGCRKFKESLHAKNLSDEHAVPFDKSKSHKNAINFSVYSLPKWALFKACMSREFLLMKRNSFIYIFKSVQLIVMATFTMTVFLRTQMGTDLLHANNYLGALFYSLIILVVDGLPEVAMTVARLDVFYKQRDLYFYPAWAYAIPATILKIPLSLLEAVIWTSLTYYTIGYSPEVGRFFRQMVVFFAVHFTSISMFRFVAAVFQTLEASATVGSLSVLFVLLLSGFMIPRPSMPIWLKWAFWISPLSYGEIGLSTNEFLAPRWTKTSGNTTVGHRTLESRGLSFDGHLFWISLAALFGFAVLFNIGFTLALSFVKASSSRAIISMEKLSELQGKELVDKAGTKKQFDISLPSPTAASSRGRMVLPFEPLSIVFQDVQYYVEPPKAMKESGFSQKKLQLLRDITGAFRPGVLTALMGVSGAGKTTLLDVLVGRKTSGIIEGVIKIGGYPKVQRTFSRISGYCEQTDVHSPQITVEESVVFSAWLRLHPEIDRKTKFEFVKEVLEIIELDGIKDALVGTPGVDGLSTEQRKRLTIAVELVANPSIIFMDEPTTGLDARAAAIVMRAVKNVADTGRTIVCTIHQPSIDIFEAFDEDISGVPKFEDSCNPATWMLEVTCASSEAELGIDFSHIYMNSALHDTSVRRELSSTGRDLQVVGACSAQVIVEIPYVLAQSLVFTVITYPMIGYYWSAYKIFWYFYTMFCTLLYYTYLGMLLIAITPRFPVAAILQSAFYTTFNLFAGFLIPRPQIPKWWIWFYYVIPTSWSLNGVLTSQFGDVDKEISVFGQNKTVTAFLRDYFGFRHDMLPLVAFVLILYPIVFASLFAYCIGKLNFQRR
ncbi:UNVERIFIED_CONTAM: Pleiotropic drug resistance protein 3 [Sesamum latifolium]|uniref:Pleiotropic drug resistance protein 3 n=1 Tax=Sesamum latifolium TaxID=2727402 RepID=A0AAW2XKG3_9LAMI